VAQIREISSGLKAPEGPVALKDGSVLVVELRRDQEQDEVKAELLPGKRTVQAMRALPEPMLRQLSRGWCERRNWKAYGN
jgi:hypothetical protein